MTLQCIVCNSTAVIHKDAAKTMAVLVSIISSAIQGAATPVVTNQPAQAKDPHGRMLGQLLALVCTGLSGAAAGGAAGTKLSHYIEKYWFNHVDYLCLSCGFNFDPNATA